jgi:hypothetical protein
MRKGASRDGRQQSRLLRGNKNGFEICTVDHQKGGKVRLDASITYKDTGHEVGVYAHEDEAFEHDQYFKVYQPQLGDQGYICGAEEEEQCIINKSPVSMDTRLWWRLSSGRVLGVLNGMLLEYDSSTLAPLGLVLPADELLGKYIAVVDSGVEGECYINFDDVGMEGADCESTYNEREQAIIVHGEEGHITVVQPNEDGSYWRKIVRNKIARMKEKRREKAAKNYAVEQLGKDEATVKELVVSTWGPYTSTVGNAL